MEDKRSLLMATEVGEEVKGGTTGEAEIGPGKVLWRDEARRRFK